MFKFLKDRKKKDNKGFTLVELVIVIAILAILVGLLAPQYVKYVEKSRKSADTSNLDNLVEGLKVAAADTEYKLSTTDADIVYTIVISDKGCALLKDGTAVKSTDNDQACAAIKEYSGIDLTTTASLETKSMKWGTSGDAKISGATSQIYATVTIKKDDSVTVEYSTNVTNYSKNGKVS